MNGPIKKYLCLFLLISSFTMAKEPWITSADFYIPGNSIIDNPHEFNQDESIIFKNFPYTNKSHSPLIINCIHLVASEFSESELILWKGEPPYTEDKKIVSIITGGGFYKFSDFKIPVKKKEILNLRCVNYTDIPCHYSYHIYGNFQKP